MILLHRKNDTKNFLSNLSKTHCSITNFKKILTHSDFSMSLTRKKRKKCKNACAQNISVAY